MKIFLTGATGFLGGEILVLLSKNPQVEKIYCLVRASAEVDVMARLRKIFSFHGDFFDPKKIIPVIGDMQDSFLSEKLSAMKNISDVNVIIHSAANTSFSKIYDSLVERVNIGGTNQILSWAKTLQSLETFAYVGTATICGRDAVHRKIFEDESPNIEARQLVKYCHTKTIGEINVASIIPEEKLLIVRPSIVLGDSRQWLPRSYVIMWSFAGFNMVRLLPLNPDLKLDVIPVDYATEAIVKLLFVKRNHTVYHISAGEISHSTVGQAVSSMLHGRGYPEPRFISYPELKNIRQWVRGKLDSKGLFARENSEYLIHLEKTLGKGNLRILLGALDDYFRFGHLGQVFDNTRMLQDTGMDPPEPVHSYMMRNNYQIGNINVLEGAIDP